MTSSKLFDFLHGLSITDADLVEVTVDENGDFEFEIDYDFFMAMLEESIDE